LDPKQRRDPELLLLLVVQSMEERRQWGHVINICCAEEGSGMHAATKQAVCAMAHELRWGRKSEATLLCSSAGGAGLLQPCCLQNACPRVSSAPDVRCIAFV
jgi:hypothetical protein